MPAGYSRSIGTLFNKNQDPALSSAERIKGKIVVSEGFAFPQKVLEFEQKGAIGVIAVNPGADAHWGICTSIWGTPDLDDLPRKPGIPVVAVNNPDGKELIALAENGGRATIAHRDGRRLVPAEGAGGRDQGARASRRNSCWCTATTTAGTSASATTRPATPRCSSSRACCGRTARSSSARCASPGGPGHSTGRYAGSTWFADHFAIDLDENCVAQVNCDSPGCRWATMFKDISWMPETEAYVQSAIKAVTGLDSHGERPHRAGDYAFNNIGISSFFMLSSTMPDDLRAEKGYYTVGGCGGNIAWHTEHDLIDIADKEILLRDIKVYAQAVIGVANATILPFDWSATIGEFAATVEKYQKEAGDAFDLSPAAKAVKDLDKALKKFQRAIKAGKMRPAKANPVILGLARILVPINFTREARFRHDPAVPIPQLPALSAASEIAGMPKDRTGFRAHATDARTEPRGCGAAPGDAHGRERAVDSRRGDE